MKRTARKTKRAARKIGRPTKRTPQIEQSLLDHLAGGGSVLAWAKSADVNASTVYDWLLSDPSLSQRFARAREAGLLVIEDEILRIADERDRSDNDDVQHRKLRIYAREKRLVWGNPDRYGQKSQIRQDVTHRIQLSDEQREERIKQLLAKAACGEQEDVQRIDVRIDDAEAENADDAEGPLASD